MSVKPYRGPFSSFLLESSPAWIFVVGVACLFVAPVLAWIRHVFIDWDHDPLNVGGNTGQIVSQSVDSVYTHHTAVHTGSSGGGVLVFLLGAAVVISGVLAAVLPMWAAARLIADAVRESGSVADEARP